MKQVLEWEVRNRYLDWKCFTSKEPGSRAWHCRKNIIGELTSVDKNIIKRLWEECDFDCKGRNGDSIAIDEFKHEIKKVVGNEEFSDSKEREGVVGDWLNVKPVLTLSAHRFKSENSQVRSDSDE